MEPISIDDDIRSECLFTMEEFIEMCKHGVVSNDDGTGYYASKDVYYRDRQIFPDKIRKSEILFRVDDYSHVIWFNK